MQIISIFRILVPFQPYKKGGGGISTYYIIAKHYRHPITVIAAGVGTSQQATGGEGAAQCTVL